MSNENINSYALGSRGQTEYIHKRCREVGEKRISLISFMNTLEAMMTPQEKKSVFWEQISLQFSDLMDEGLFPVTPLNFPTVNLRVQILQDSLIQLGNRFERKEENFED